MLSGKINAFVAGCVCCVLSCFFGSGLESSAVDCYLNVRKGKKCKESGGKCRKKEKETQF